VTCASHSFVAHTSKNIDEEEHRMQFGLTLPNVGRYGDARMLADLARLAEEAGWGGFFLWDTLHFQADENAVCDPWIALAAIAMRTERIRIGTMVAAPTRRRPWKMARETATLDHLSHGRFILGVGAGDGSDRGFTNFGEESDVRKRARLLDESLAIMQGLWSAQPFSYSGEFYHVKEITFLPPPVQTPRIPIWIGGRWPNGGPMSRAARFDGVNVFTKRADGTFGDLTPEEIHQVKLLMDEHHTTPAPFDVVTGGPVFAAVADEQARAMLRAYAAAGATWCLENIWPERDVDSIQVAIQKGPPRLD
jgi:alkanesulfonate monooxygenase SsuD/methylene tetrahydromethanopterin reductase-like flavin-dependent oxidoreductase (luciferase family)